MEYDSDVQSSGGRGWHERVWAFVSDRPSETDIASKITERITLDIPAADFAFLKQLAVYRNVSNKLALEKARKALKAKGQKAGKGQRIPAESRKSLAQDFIRTQCMKQQEVLRLAQDACGPMPVVSSHKVTPEQKKAMEAWARKVDAWTEKTEKNSK